MGGRSIAVTQVAWGCTFGITPLAITAPAAGSTGTVLISAAHAGCAWTAAGAPAWITFPGGASGSGSATLAYAIATNYAPAERQGGFTVGGYAVAVTQAASACTFTLDRTSLAFGTNGGADDARDHDEHASCAWTASTASAAWLTVRPTSGSGTATITVTAAGNYGTTRIASLGVAGTTVAVTQDGSVTPSGPMTCYLAEGATSAFLDTRLALLNPGSIGTSATLTFSRIGKAPVTHVVPVPALHARHGQSQADRRDGGGRILDEGRIRPAAGRGSHAVVGCRRLRCARRDRGRGAIADLVPRRGRDAQWARTVLPAPESRAHRHDRARALPAAERRADREELRARRRHRARTSGSTARTSRAWASPSPTPTSVP